MSIRCFVSAFIATGLLAALMFAGLLVGHRASVDVAAASQEAFSSYRGCASCVSMAEAR